MISTVTTTTVMTVTTATVGIIGGMTVLAVALLLGMLISKEILSASDHPRLAALSKALNVTIVPLLWAFLVIAGVKVLEVLF